MIVCCRRSRCQRAMRWRWVRRGRLIRRATGTSILPAHGHGGFVFGWPSLDDEPRHERRRERQGEDVVDLSIAGIAVEDERRNEHAGEVREHHGLAGGLTAPSALADEPHR